jgi:hypothetical protein
MYELCNFPPIAGGRAAGLRRIRANGGAGAHRCRETRRKNRQAAQGGAILPVKAKGLELMLGIAGGRPLPCYGVQAAAACRRGKARTAEGPGLGRFLPIFPAHLQHPADQPPNTSGKDSCAAATSMTSSAS